MMPSVGETISRYQLLSKLGEGGTGAVYRARDTLLNRDVALKFLLQSGEDSEASREALLREARVAAALEHPNVCAIYEVGEAEGQTFIVMALVDGQSLSALLLSSLVKKLAGFQLLFDLFQILDKSVWFLVLPAPLLTDYEMLHG